MDWSDLKVEKNLIRRLGMTLVGGGQPLVVPARAGIMRLSGGGAGGGVAGAQGFGHGGAFARVKLVVNPGDAFTVQIGAPQTNTAAGDTTVTRNADNVVILKAARGTPVSPGLAADCVGDVKRSGLPGQMVGGYPRGGNSAGDDEDPFPLGFGGRGGIGTNDGRTYRSAYPGGGAVAFLAYASGGYQVPAVIQAGAGRLVAEFFDSDPGY